MCEDKILSSMKKLEFDIKIEAPTQKVWDILWNDNTYRKWTSVFHEGSRAVTDWKEGSKVLFLGEEDNGMYALIEKKVPNREMIFLHQGEIIKVEERPWATGDWGESRESYFLEEDGTITKLRVELDSPDEYADYFTETFPKSLGKVKELAEA
jgi:uncharacterized protein YndB with AHSA1/START domain